MAWRRGFAGWIGDLQQHFVAFPGLHRSTLSHVGAALEAACHLLISQRIPKSAKLLAPASTLDGNYRKNKNGELT
jgi:hypothetical protein